jgi:hypothetical protein
MTKMFYETKNLISFVSSLREWGALKLRAEIIPFEPGRVMPSRERVISNAILHFHLFINYLIIKR